MIRPAQEKRQTLSPSYQPEDNNTFEYVGLTGPPFPAVQFRVMDWNRWAPKKPMGEFVLQLDINSDTETRWYELQPPDNEDRSSLRKKQSRLHAVQTLGELRVRMSVRAQAGTISMQSNKQIISRWFGEDELTKLRAPNVLRVAVVSARDFELPRRQSMRMGVSRNRLSSNSCDPQAVIRYRGLTRKTKIVRRTQRPVWSTTFDLRRPDDGGTEILNVDVYDLRSLWEPKRLGRAQIDCSTSSVIAKECVLDPRGFVTLAWQLAYDPALDETSDCDWFSSITGGVDYRNNRDDVQPDEVHVVIVRVRTLFLLVPKQRGDACILSQARGLRAADFAMIGRQATSDPYVKLRVVKWDNDYNDSSSFAEMFGADRWLQTDVVQRSLSPVWNARFALPLSAGSLGDDDDCDGACYRLCLEIFDRDLFSSDDFLGRASVELARSAKEERERTSTAEWLPLQGEDATGEILVAYKTFCSKQHPTPQQQATSVDLALPFQPAESPRHCTFSWQPFSAADDVVSKVPNELCIGLKRVDHLPCEEASVSVVFAVSRKGQDDASETVVLEWQSKQARLFDAEAGGRECQAVFQQPFRWPLLPIHRNDEYTLVATIHSPWKLSGSASLCSVLEARPRVEEVDITLKAEQRGAAGGGLQDAVIEVIAQLRHNRCLVETAAADDYELGISDEKNGNSGDAPIDSADASGYDNLGEEDRRASMSPTDSCKPPEGKNTQQRGLPKLQAIVDKRIIGPARFRSSTHPDALPSYAAFVPAFVLSEIRRHFDFKQSSLQVTSAKATDLAVHGRAMRSTTRDAAVLFADISGFTKLTEKLNQRLNGAELLCAELDVVYGALCEEADVLGGDAVKFAGDAICFIWVVEGAERGGADLRQATRRAALCAHRAHFRIKKHPAIEGVKLSLHAGLSVGQLTLLTLVRERPAGQRQQSEFIVAGQPLEQIGIAEYVLLPIFKSKCDL